MLGNSSSETGTAGESVIDVHLGLEALVAALSECRTILGLQLSRLDLESVG